MSDRDIVLLLLSALITAGVLIWAAINMMDNYFFAADHPVLDAKAIVTWARPSGRC